MPSLDHLLTIVFFSAAATTIAYAAVLGSRVPWLRARAVGLWRSRTVRLCAYAVALYFLVAAAGANGYRLPRGLFGSIDPVLYESAGFKIVLAGVGVVVVMNVLAAFDNMAGLSFRKHWLPALFGYDPLAGGEPPHRGGARAEPNLAVAIYLAGRFVGACLLVGWGLG